MTPISLKICCISSCDEADIAIAAGANMLGLAAEMRRVPVYLDGGLHAGKQDLFLDSISLFMK